MDGKILIVDPSTVEREKIKHLLALLGSFEVLEAASAYEFEMLEDQLDTPLLVIMDIALPGEQDGYSTLETLRRRCPADTPVIVISRLAGLEHRSTTLKFGVDDFIEKPYTLNRLKKSIQTLLPMERKFDYSTRDIPQIMMSFDDFMARELKYAQRTGTSLSLVLMSRNPVSSGKGDGQTLSAPSDETFLTGLLQTLRDMLRTTDTVVSNPNGDIIILLPGTNSEQARAVQEKVDSCRRKSLPEDTRISGEAYLTAPVTFPEDGESFLALMQSAFRKLETREMLERTGSIPAKTRQFANRRYNQFNRWF